MKVALRPLLGAADVWEGCWLPTKFHTLGFVGSIPTPATETRDLLRSDSPRQLWWRALVDKVKVYGGESRPSMAALVTPSVRVR